MRAEFKILTTTLICTVAACSINSHREVVPIAHSQAPLPSQHDATIANDILFRAIGLVGTPYHWGGNTPQSGFDCSGLIDYVFSEMADVKLPRTVPDIYAQHLNPVAREGLRGGDLLFFNTSGHGVTHIGIYVGEDRFVHAPNEGGTVRLDYLSNPYWEAHFRAARRVPL